EHDVFFWETFLEIVRVVRPGGLIYLDAPSNHEFHRYPLDCWRFYPDAGIALVRWAAREGMHVELVESFVAAPGADGWGALVAVFRKASTEPLRRAGRIADQTAAINISDGSAQPGTELEVERPETHDMVEMTRLREALVRAETTPDPELAVLRKQVAELGAEIADLDRARVSAETALREVRESTSWRITQPMRRISERVRRK